MQPMTESVNKGGDIDVIKIKESKRINYFCLNLEKIALFFEKTKHVSVRDLEYIPYYRFLIARDLDYIFENQLGKKVVNILNQYQSGAALFSVKPLFEKRSDYLKFSTALSHLVGFPNIDLLSGKYYATFTIENDPDAPINLLRPYDNFKMHTDGSFMLEPTDWVLFMKMNEECAVGGKTKLLHMEDWDDFDFFHDHRFGEKEFVFSGPPESDKRSNVWGNHRKTDTLLSPILGIKNDYKTIRFVDQFIHPRNMQEAEYVSQIQDSLESCKNSVEVDLPPGFLLIINNHIWVHGRSKFEPNNKLKRELMRQRGAWVYDKQ